MKKRAKPGGAATFLAHPRRHSLAPCQPPRSLLSPRRRSRPTSPQKPPLPPPRSAPPIGAGERPIRTGSSASQRTAAPDPVARIPPPFCFFSPLLPDPLQSPRPPLTTHAPRPRFPCRPLFFKALGAFCSSARAEAKRLQILRQITQGERARGRALCLAGLRRTQKRATKKGRREGIGAGRGAERGEGEPKGK